MKKERQTEPDGVEIVSEKDVPRPRRRYRYDWLDEQLRALPKGSALKINCTKIKSSPEVIRTHVTTLMKSGDLPKGLEPTQRSTEDGKFLYIVNPANPMEPRK